MEKRINLVTYFGGKFPQLHWMTKLFPVGDYHFIDLMCGAANVALNVKYPLITVNDLNEDIINLFEVLREHPEEFQRKVFFTPFARQELNNIIESDRPECKIEWARHYYVKCQLGYGANGSQNDHKGCGFETTVQKSNYYRADNWNLKLQKLDVIVKKLRSFQVENKDALQLLKRFDKKGNFIYIDPPYLLRVRGSKKRYKHEVDDQFHEDLCQQLLEIKHAYVALSGYKDPFYDKRLLNWIRTDGPISKTNVKKKEVEECLWTNYDPTTVNGQISLLDQINEMTRYA